MPAALTLARGGSSARKPAKSDLDQCPVTGIPSASQKDVLAAHRGAAAPPTKKQASDTVAGLRYTTERLARDALAEIQNGMVSGTFVSRSTLTVE